MLPAPTFAQGQNQDEVDLLLAAQLEAEDRDLYEDEAFFEDVQTDMMDEM